MMRHNNHLKNDKSLDDAFVAVIVHRVHSGTDPTVYKTQVHSGTDPIVYDGSCSRWCLSSNIK